MLIGCQFRLGNCKRHVSGLKRFCLKKMLGHQQVLDYSGKIILAPMVRIGTLPTRLLALKYGAGDLCHVSISIMAVI